jgi:uncharacterized protein DUF4382
MTTRSGFTRWATALSLSLLFAVSGCEGGDGVLGVNEGRVRFSLSSSSAIDSAPQGSAPAASVGQDGTVLMPDGGRDEDHEDDRRALQSANVTMSSILARNLDGVLVNVDMELPVTVDILSMDGPTPVMLPDAVLPPDTYDQVVVVMRQVEVVTRDGTKIAITPPGGGWTAIAPICPFVVEEGETTTVGLTFMLRHSFQWREGRFTFRPRFICTQE